MRKLKLTLVLAFIFVILFSLSSLAFASYESPYAMPTYLVKYGSKNEGVKWVQDMLKQNGYTITVDGIFGSKTKSAVIHFQKYNNLSQDGIVGPLTRNALISAVNRLTSKNTVIDGTNNASALAKFNRNSTDLISIIKNCKSYLANNNFYYSTASGVRTIPMDQSKCYDSKYYVDCSSFVSWVLYEYGLANGNTNMKNYFSYQRNSATFKSIGDAGGNSYLSVVNSLSDAKAGDILVTNGHVEFLSSYVKNTNGTITMKVYNCGSNNSLNIAGLTTSGTKYESEIIYILRIK